MFGPVSLAALYFSLRYIIDSKYHQNDATKENVGDSTAKVQENEIINEKQVEVESGKNKNYNGNHKESIKANHISPSITSDQTGNGRSLNDIIKSEAQLSTLKNKPFHNRNNEQQKKKRRRFPFKKQKKECGTSTSVLSETTLKNNIISASSAAITHSETVGPDCSTDNQQQALHEGMESSLNLPSESVREIVKLMNLQIDLSSDEISLDACTQTYDHERPVNTKDIGNDFIDKQSLFYIEGDRMISFCLLEQDPGVIISEAFIKNSDLSQKNEAAVKRI